MQKIDTRESTIPDPYGYLLTYVDGTSWGPFRSFFNISADTQPLLCKDGPYLYLYLRLYLYLGTLRHRTAYDPFKSLLYHIEM